MTSTRVWAVLALAGLLTLPAAADAQGRRGGNGNGKDKRDKANGPAFCRSGAGHPVHGWEWCRDRGWERDGFSDWRGRARDRVRTRDRNQERERDRDRDQERARDRSWSIDDWRWLR